jgi:hypothetical protein
MRLISLGTGLLLANAVQGAKAVDEVFAAYANNFSSWEKLL